MYHRQTLKFRSREGRRKGVLRMQGKVVNRVEAEVRRRPVSHENVRSVF